MTNKMTIFSRKTVGGIPGFNTVITDVNSFVQTNQRAGCCNFHILPVVVTTEYTGAGLATANNWYTVQVNYYDPAAL